MDKISVFGGKGFVGSYFVKLVPNSFVHYRDEYLPVFPKIINFISTVDNYNVKTNPHLDIDTNLTLLIDLLENARQVFGNKVEFNFISSWFVYGKEVECPAKENSYCNPKGFYGITKHTAEQLLIEYCETFDMSYRIIRLGNVLGIGDKKISRKKNALQYMIQQVALGKDIDYLYEEVSVRDFIDVRDVAIAIKLILRTGELNSIYNVGNGVPVKVNDAVEYANHIVGYKSKITLMPVPKFHKTVQPKDMWLDVSKLKDLGFERQYTLQDTIKELVEHYAKQQNGS